MKKQFSQLSKAEQEEVELAYHQMNPEDFDELMMNAQHHVPDVIHLPTGLVTKLQLVAKAVGEEEYQPMVRRWIEERLQQERVAAGIH